MTDMAEDEFGHLCTLFRRVSSAFLGAFSETFEVTLCFWFTPLHACGLPKRP